jgi:hypothetical protein
MSTYEWERGSISIPKSEWAAFRKAIINAHNSSLEKDLTDALKALALIKAAAKGKRGEGRVAVEKATLATFCGISTNLWEGEDLNIERFHRLERLLFATADGKAWEDRNILQTPKKKDLCLLPLTGDVTINLMGATISLKNETVFWDVSENNHAIEYARKQPLAVILFNLLNKIEWTDTTGGRIVGNDEYNQDNSRDHEGGGGNYLRQEFSKAAQKRARETPVRQNYAGWR